MKTRTTALLIGVFALAAGAVTALTVPAIPTNDAVPYLSQTFLYPLDIPRNEVDIAYPFGYPLFLDALMLFGGVRNLPLSLVVVQQALGAATAVLIFLLGKRLGRPWAGGAAAIWFSLYLPRMLYAQALASETLFTFLLTASAWAFAEAVQDPSRPKALRAGILAAAAMAVKPMGGALVFPLFLFFFFKRRAAAAAAAIAPAILLLGLILASNAIVYGNPTLGDCLGRHLADQAWGEKGSPTDDPGGRLIRSELSKSKRPAAFPAKWWNYWHALKDGRTNAQADHLLTRAAAMTFAADPAAWGGRAAYNAARNIYDWDGRFDVKKDIYENRRLTDVLRKKESIDGRWRYSSEDFRGRYEHLAHELGYYAPPKRLGAFGEWWIDFFGQNKLKLRDPRVAMLFVIAFGWAMLWGGAGFRAAVLSVLSVHLFAAATEASCARYFEPIMPLAMLSAAAMAAAPLQGLRTIFPKFRRDSMRQCASAASLSGKT